VNGLASRISFVNLASDRVLVVANPSAGSRSREQAVSDLVVCLKERGLTPQLVTDLSSLGPLAARYRALGQLRAVVAAGGDGTVAEVVNRTEPDIPVSVFPLGTANLLASYFHIECDPMALARTLVEGVTVSLDAGKANGRVFLLMAGCGFDAEVVERAHRRRNGKHITYWTYARPILGALRSYRYPTLRVYQESTPGTEWTSPPHLARWAFLVNLPCYAGGLQVAPDAVGTDGLLDACTFGSGSFWHALRYLGYVAIRRHRGLADFKWALVTRARIESEEPVPYQLDGDPGGFLPLTIEVLPQRFSFVAPLARLVALGLDSAEPSSAGAR
jgi:diacylglycerol kinase family enzyme